MKYNLIIREISEAREMSIHQLARLASVPQSTINNWLNSNMRPNVYDLAKVADVLECSVDYLIGRENEEGHIIIADDYRPQPITRIQSIYNKLNDKNQIQAIFYCQGLLDGQ